MNPELSYAGQPVSTEPAPAPQNVFSRLVGIWFSPGETFAEIGRAPRWLVPTLLFVLLSTVGVYLLTERYGRERIAREQIEMTVNAGWIPEDKAAEVIQQATSPAAINQSRITGTLGMAVFMMVMLLIVAGLLKAASLMMGYENTFKALLSVTAFSFLAVGVVTTLVLLVTAYLKDPTEIDMLNPISSNLASVLTMAGVELPKFVMGLLSYVDLFGIWRLALLAIGCAAVTRKMKTGTAMTILVVLYLIGALVGAAMGAMFTK
jgi:Yip1 domain